MTKTKLLSVKISYENQFQTANVSMMQVLKIIVSNKNFGTHVTLSILLTNAAAEKECKIVWRKRCCDDISMVRHE